MGVSIDIYSILKETHKSELMVLKDAIDVIAAKYPGFTLIIDEANLAFNIYVNTSEEKIDQVEVSIYVPQVPN